MSQADLVNVIAEARRIWDAREQKFPPFVRMTWAQGTQLAREAAMIEAMQNLGIEAP